MPKGPKIRKTHKTKKKLFFLLLDKPRSYITIDLILYAPMLQISVFEDSTDDCIIVPTIHFSTEKV